MGNLRRILALAGVVVMLLSVAAPAMAHTKFGLETNWDGCDYNYYDTDGNPQGAYSATMTEYGGNTCQYVRAKIKVYEGGWVYRQNTSTWRSVVSGQDATDMDWVSHQWKKNNQWRSWTVQH